MISRDGLNEITNDLVDELRPFMDHISISSNNLMRAAAALPSATSPYPHNVAPQQPQPGLLRLYPYHNRRTFLHLESTLFIPAEDLLVLDGYAFSIQELIEYATHSLKDFYRNPHIIQNDENASFSDVAITKLRMHHTLAPLAKKLDETLALQTNGIRDDTIDAVLVLLKAIDSNGPEGADAAERIFGRYFFSLSANEQTRLNAYLIRVQFTAGHFQSLTFEAALIGGNRFDRCTVTLQIYLWQFVVDFRPAELQNIPLAVLSMQARHKLKITAKTSYASSMEREEKPAAPPLSNEFFTLAEFQSDDISTRDREELLPRLPPRRAVSRPSITPELLSLRLAEELMNNSRNSTTEQESLRLFQRIIAEPRASRALSTPIDIEEKEEKSESFFDRVPNNLHRARLAVVRDEKPDASESIDASFSALPVSDTQLPRSVWSTWDLAPGGGEGRQSAQSHRPQAGGRLVPGRGVLPDPRVFRDLSEQLGDWSGPAAQREAIRATRDAKNVTSLSGASAANLSELLFDRTMSLSSNPSTLFVSAAESRNDITLRFLPLFGNDIPFTRSVRGFEAAAEMILAMSGIGLVASITRNGRQLDESDREILSRLRLSLRRDDEHRSNNRAI